MNLKNELLILVVIWFAAAGLMLFKTWKSKYSCGLTFFYIANLSLLHFFGALIYVLPWYGYGDIEITLKGFRVATYGVIAFAVGNLILTPCLRPLFNIRLNKDMTVTDTKLLSNLPKIYLFIGIISYLILFSTISRLPTLNALIAVGQQLMVIGICLACWKAWCERNKKGLMTWLLISLIFPFITIITQGFIGYGAIMTMIILLFVARFFRPRWEVLIAGLLLAYLGLTLYQSYMRDRVQLRAVIWGGAPVSERVKELSNTLSKTEWFNPYDVNQLERIDDRLNQNFLVGKAVDYLKVKDYAEGETLWDSIIALVPRIIWPDKPIRAGGHIVVSEYTGLKFYPGTSVGVGQVMEFYINFGTVCVIIGFLVLGIIIAIIDIMAGYNLLKGNWQRFALWILPGLAFINVGGSLVEVTSSAGAGVVVAYFVSRLRSAHYPIVFASFYIFITGYIGFKYILPLINPYAGILMFMLIIAIIVKKYLLPILARKKSVGQ